MIEKILSTMQSLRLSVTEWLAVTAAVLIGGLVAALKVQGSRLHRAQVQLAGQARDARALQEDKDSSDADERYRKLRAEYLKAGGKL